MYTAWIRSKQQCGYSAKESQKDPWKGSTMTRRLQNKSVSHGKIPAWQSSAT